MPLDEQTQVVTIRDVARHAGVAVSIVSRVFTSKPQAVRISDLTAQRVRHIATQMGYAPNAAASALRRRRTGNIALLMSDELVPGVSSDAIIGKRISHIEPACAARGFSLLLIRYDPLRPALVMEKIASRAADGLLLTGLEDRQVIDLCRRVRVPCLDVTGTLGLMPVCTVEADLVSIRCEALHYARGLGHRRVAIACLDTARHRQLFTAVAQRAARDSALAGCHLRALELPVTADSDEGDLLCDAWQAVPAHERPTLVMAYENLALGFLNTLKARVLACPRDVSLITLSKSPLSENTTPRITGITNAVEEASRLSVKILLDAVEAGRLLTQADSPPLLPCNFVVRESCAALEAAA